MKSVNIKYENFKKYILKNRLECDMRNLNFGVQ